LLHQAELGAWLAKIAARIERDLISAGDLGAFGAAAYSVRVPDAGKAWWLARDGDSIRVLDRWEGGDPRATVTLSSDAATRIASGHFRMHSIADAASVLIEGDAEHLMELLLPHLYADDTHARVLEVFARAEAAHHREPMVGPIPRIERPSPEVAHDLMARFRPAILTGLVGSTPAGRWTFDLLRDRYGDVVVEQSVDGRRPVTLRERIDLMRSGADTTTGGGKVPAEMRSDVDFEPYVAASDQRFHPLFWMGRAGSRTPLHRDAYPGMSAHLLGRKRWLLYSPDQADRLYPEEGSVEAYQRSRVDPYAPDLARWPRFAEATPRDVVVNPGELLLVPVGWFHDVQALDDAVSVTLARNDEL
jgi:hypothetical protein